MTRFEELAAGCERGVYLTCLHMMGNREDALDCAQDAMLRAFRAFGSYREEAQFSTWIKKIAVNACIDAIRKRRQTVSLDKMREEGFDPPLDLPAPYERLAQKERAQALREALSRLPEDQRAIITLRDIEGMPYDQVAKALDIPLGTVKSRVNRAREKLANLLKLSGELFSSPSV